MAEPYYLTAAELKADPGIPDAMADADALALIENAEDQVDELLGARAVDETTGRKVVQGDVETWRWTKLKRATLKLAVRLYADPKLADGERWASVSGPDFSVSDAVGQRFGRDVEAALNQSGLRRLTTVLGSKADRPPWYSFSYNDPDAA